MSTKTLIFLGMLVGSIIGGYIPVLFGADIFSYISVITSGLGALLGIWLGYKISKL
ncbi:MAG: XapX domain-containing protein [Candidatus Daviesbacteria bacterium]|nr:XapX domain-containing protein [Candidatus Daviesbacteria bacterium]